MFFNCCVFKFIEKIIKITLNHLVLFCGFAVVKNTWRIKMVPLNSRVIKCVTRISRGATTRKLLNKENKLLFGPLLESSSARKAMLKDNPAAVLSDVIMEPAKLPPPPKRARPKPYVNQRLNILKSADDLQIHLSEKPSTLQKHIIDLTSSIPPNKANIFDLEGRKYLKNDEDLKVLSLQNKICKTMKKIETGHPIILPDTVVRNITSFPLISNKNTQKANNITWENARQLPSVTKILSETMSDDAKAALERWRSNLIKELGEDGYLKLQQEQLSQGGQFHALVQAHLSGETFEIEPKLAGCWQSLSHNILSRVGLVESTEKNVVHPWLLYKGIADCVAEFDGVPAVIEWKKSEKQKPTIKNTFDAPLQLAAYVGALSFDPSCKFKFKRGVVVVAYTDGSPANAFPLKLSECSIYWSAWLRRLQMYWRQQATNSQ